MLQFFSVKKPTPYRYLVTGLITLLITDALDAAWPMLLKVAIDQIEAQSPLSEIQKTAFMIFAFISGLAIFRYAWRVEFGKFYVRVSENLRLKLFSHLIKLPYGFYVKNTVGNLMSVLTSDIQSFKQGIGPGLLMLADAIMLTVFIIPIMIHLHLDWTYKTLFFFPVIPILSWKVMKAIFDGYKNQQADFDILNSFAQESLNGIRVIKCFHQEQNNLSEFQKTNRKYEESCNKVSFVDSLYLPIIEFSIGVGGASLLYFGGKDVIAGTATLGTFVAFYRYIIKLVWPMEAIGLSISFLQKARTSYDRVEKLLNEKVEADGNIEIQEFISLEFKNVSFTYDDTNTEALKNISFKIDKGEKIGITGPIGAGKTTLMNLITGVYKPTHGEILINNIPIQNINTTSLRKRIILVPQDVFLFSDTIKENISFGVHPDLNHIPNEVPLETLDQMTSLVQFKQEVYSLPNKYDTLVGEKGVNLSGGQKQRLSISRGLIVDSDVVLLDDSLSAVDTESEELIEKEISRKSHTTLPKKNTLVIVGHRLSTLKSMDRILVLKQGEVEAFASPKELLEFSPTFKKIFEIQNQEVQHV